MKQLQFNIHKNFLLETSAWGDVSHYDIVALLDNVVLNFYKNLDATQISIKTVFLKHSSTRIPPVKCPIIFKNEPFNEINLCAQHTYWGQYAYEFSHELCHHVIDPDTYSTDHKFGWLEESICELSSICALLEMSNTFRNISLEPRWGEDADKLLSYANDILYSSENVIDKAFHQWLTDGLDLLYGNRYNRKMNRIVAVHLFPIFQENPKLWQVVHYFKNVQVFEAMNLDQFLKEWKKGVPSDLIEKFETIERTLLSYDQ
jgi:hypothetical protein